MQKYVLFIYEENSYSRSIGNNEKVTTTWRFQSEPSSYLYSFCLSTTSFIYIFHKQILYNIVLGDMVYVTYHVFHH